MDTVEKLINAQGIILCNEIELDGLSVLETEEQCEGEQVYE